MRFFLDSATARVEIGDGTFINRRSELVCKDSLTIGSDCAISWDVLISDTDYHSVDGSVATRSVRVGNHVWLAARSAILRGSQVGDDSVVGFGAVVRGVFDDNVLLAGAPADEVRRGISWRL